MKSKDLDTLKKLALADNADAMFELGVRHLEMRGVPAGTTTVQAGVMWLEAAADKGHVEAAFRLGEEYSHQRVVGIKLDYKTGYKEALNWFSIAQANGHERARERMLNAMSYYEMHSHGEAWEPSRPLHLSDSMVPPWAHSAGEATDAKGGTGVSKEVQKLAEEKKYREEVEAKRLAARLTEYREKRFAEEEKKVAARDRKAARRKVMKVAGALILWGALIGFGIFLWVEALQSPSGSGNSDFGKLLLEFIGGYFISLFFRPEGWLAGVVFLVGVCLWASNRGNLLYDPTLYPDVRTISCKNCAYCAEHYVNTVTTVYEDDVVKSSTVTDVRHDHYECRHPSVEMVVQDGNSCNHFLHFVDAEFMKKHQDEQEAREKKEAEEKRLQKAGFRN